MATVDLSPFKQYAKERCGLSFEGVSEKPLADGLNQRIVASNAESAEAYLNKLHRDPDEFHTLVELLTVNETYFYREQEQLQFVLDTLVPRLLAQRIDDRPIRILSAGCSSGEELYSIAIALREKFGFAAATWFTLVGGDIDLAALQRARIAQYKQFSFRALAETLRTRYFSQIDDFTWEIKEDLRRQVSFHHFNLLDQSRALPVQNFDLIFYRNVSIYFDTPTRLAVLQQLASLLVKEGMLVTGSAETLANDLGVLKLVAEGDSFYFSTHDGTAMTAPAANLFSWSEDGLAQRDSVTPKRPPVRCAEAASPPSLTASSLARCRSLIEAKRYDDAQKLLDALPARQADSSEAHLLAAYVRLQRKDYDAAERLAQQVLDKDAWSVDALILRGMVAKWCGRAEEAVTWFKQAVYTRQDCWPAHYYLADLYRTGNQVDQARRAYRAVFQILSGEGQIEDGLSIIPLSLPRTKVRFLCRHQLEQLDQRAVKREDG
jgi:chemotaxis protein methyltransferase CheR